MITGFGIAAVVWIGATGVMAGEHGPLVKTAFGKPLVLALLSALLAYLTGR